MRKNGKQEFGVVLERDEAANSSAARLKRIAILKAQIERLQFRLTALAGDGPRGDNSSKAKNLSGLHPDIRRLTGLAPADWDATAIYYEHLTGRRA
jgi:hypothetical protein